MAQPSTSARGLMRSPPRRAAATTGYASMIAVAPRSAAWPSHSGIAHGVGACPDTVMLSSVAGSSPSRVLVPCVIVTGRSVFARSV